MQILKVIQKRGYTLERVADELGITKGSLSATINGSPNVKKLIDIALKIGCSPAEFFDDWYENIKKLQLYDTGVTAEYGDEFITLSVCAYHVDNGRLVVVGKRIK